VDEAAAWFELFRAFGRAPSPDSYAAVFHPEGEVADAGMATPTPASQVRAAIAHVLRLMPDLRIDMMRYRARGPVVFVEAANRGTINGTAVQWGAVYRVHLRDGLVHRGRRFYDQATLFRALRPDLGWLPQLPATPGAGAVTYADVMPGAPLSAPYSATAGIEVPDQRRPLSPAELKLHLAGAPFTVVDSAGDATLAFVEWRRGDLLGVDRLELADGRITTIRRYFDTLGLLAAHDTSVTALRAQLLSNAHADAAGPVLRGRARSRWL
jgi:ketosteroid isomerase-like protein